VDEFLTDEERATQAKSWLRENGPFMVIGLVVALGGLFGWNKWQDYQVNHAEKASAVYEELVAAIASERAITAGEKFNQIVGEFGATPYKDHAQLAMAKLHVDRNEFDEAAEYLQSVARSGYSDEIQNIARLRLARLRIHQQKFDEALDTLDVPENTAFAGRFHEVRGDALVAAGRPNEARDEYQLALALESSGVVDRVYVEAKLNDVSSADITDVNTAESGQPVSDEEDDG